MASKAAGSKAATPEQQVKELARKDFNKKCFDCGRGVSAAPLSSASASTAAPPRADLGVWCVCALCQGPQQNVNLTVHTFVCTACSGLLRNFNHQLKTINMYSFKPQEVAALEEGGNKKARKYWLHFYDAENPREFRPDMDDPKQVLEFMKLMYDQKKCPRSAHTQRAQQEPPASAAASSPLSLCRHCCCQGEARCWAARSAAAASCAAALLC